MIQQVFRAALDDPGTASALSEMFGAHRAARADAAAERNAPDPAEFLRARGIAVPETGTLSVVFTERTSDAVQPMRPEPGCPGGWCVPERCPKGVLSCGWICYCP